MQNNSFGNNRSSFSNSSRFNSPSNNSFGSSGSRFGSPGGGNSNLSKEEKVEIIKKAYEEVLDREATRRDINFYKYSQIDEESMKIKLIKTKEHKDLIKLGRKYKQLKEEYDNTLGQLKMYQSKMKDHSEVIREMQTVLDEKNGYITELRRELRNYKSATGGFDSQDPNSRAMTINAYSDADGTQDRVNNQRKTENKYEESASLMDELRNFIKSLFDF
jgi:chromosome segregation ATPase